MAWYAGNKGCLSVLKVGVWRRWFFYTPGSHANAHLLGYEDPGGTKKPGCVYTFSRL